MDLKFHSINERWYLIMTQLQRDFFSRLQLPQQEYVQFQDLHKILLQMGRLLPYENIDIMNGNTQEVSKENIRSKLLLNNRGGLCYELNSLLYYFLSDYEFNVYRISGTLFDSKSQKWGLDDGHVSIILQYKTETYIVDAGFASYLPLRPVPFNGEIVSSTTGQYRVRKQNTDKGTHVLEMRKGENGETSHFFDSELTDTWSIGYAFSLEAINEEKVNTIQDTVITHSESPVNRGYIICKLIGNGHISLTKQNFTQTQNGKKFKKTITEKQFYQILKTTFNIVLDN